MHKILCDINASIAQSFNRPSREQVLRDEMTFAANGYAGAVLSLDFKELIVRGVRVYLLLGCDFNGHLRFLEANTELAALGKSQFLKNLRKGDVPFPPSFEVHVGKEEKLVVPALILVDHQIMIGLQNCSNEYVHRHMLGPAPWNVAGNGHDWSRAVGAGRFSAEIEVPRWAVERCISWRSSALWRRMRDGRTHIIRKRTSCTMTSLIHPCRARMSLTSHTSR